MATPGTRDGEVIDGRYRLIELLGEGGIGVTFRSQRLDDGQEVALKELALRGMRDWKVLELFEREARVLAQLQDPAIPRYLDAFSVERDGGPLFYLVQELAPGRDLGRAVAAGWRPDEEEVRSIATQVLGALDYLHGLSPPVIHRDLKPQNLIRSEHGQIFLVDFGSVRDTYADTVLGGSTVAGTFGYMAPEQGQGQASPASDLYGLGATLVHLLTGKHPGELPRRRMKLAFRPHARVSPGLARWLDRMIAPVAEERFASAQQALTALGAVSAGAGWPRWVAVATLAAAVAGGIGATLWLRGDGAEPQRPAVAARVSDARPTLADAAHRVVERRAPPPMVPCSPKLRRQLRADYQRLLASAPPDTVTALEAAATKLRRPKDLNWWQHMEAFSTLRVHRARAAIPLLLELGCTYADDRLNQSRAARLLVILTGEEAPQELLRAAEDETTAPGERARLHRELVESWWTPRRETLDVDLLRMRPARQLTALREMARLRARLPLSQRAYRLAGYLGLAMAASEEYRNEKLEWQGLVEPMDRLDWYAVEKLSPRLLPALLRAAAELPLRWDAIMLLDQMHRAGNAGSLRSIVSDGGRPKALRLVALLALRRSGESPSAALLHALARQERDPRLRLPAVLALRYFRSPQAEELALELGRSEDLELRTAAVWVLLGYRTQRALPVLQALLPKSKDRPEARAALWLLFFLSREVQLTGVRAPYTTPAVAYARALLAEPPGKQDAGRLRDALDGFWRTTGVQVVEPQAGTGMDEPQPDSASYYRRKLNEALRRFEARSQ
jgi:serine/threonine protein kinase